MFRNLHVYCVRCDKVSFCLKIKVRHRLTSYGTYVTFGTVSYIRIGEGNFQGRKALGFCRFSPDAETSLGLVQREGGPCGVLAPIQVSLCTSPVFSFQGSRCLSTTKGGYIPHFELLSF